MEAALVLAIAVIIDLAVGEYPARLHPSVWAGRLIDILEKPAHSFKANSQLVYGAAMSFFIIVFFAVSSWALLRWAQGISEWVFILVAAILLKPAFCLRQQADVARQTEKVLLGQDNVPARMQPLFDTVNLQGAPKRQEVISSSVRSLAENASDFVVAPLFYYLLLGVPGAIAYRVANTLDSMIGYHGKYEYLGKFAARLDDVLNYIPARLTGALFCLASFTRNKGAKDAWSTMWRDHALTPSPNAGWPMAAAAGALGVQLSKVNGYSLGNPCRALEPSTISRSVALYRDSMVIFSIVLFGLLILFGRGEI